MCLSSRRELRFSEAMRGFKNGLRDMQSANLAYALRARLGESGLSAAVDNLARLLDETAA